MTENPSPGSPLTQHHAQVLVRYADAFAAATARDFGENVLDRHTDDVRSLAARISRYATEGAGAFTRGDVDLLTSIGDGLVKPAVRLMADPNITPGTRHDAQFRLGLGNEVLTVRGIVRARVPE